MSTPGIQAYQAVRLDHVLLGVSDLEEGIDHLERETGVRPVFGGSHPELGTHNALLGLGPDLYLELIAVRSEVEDAGPLESLRDCAHPTPVAWCLATRNRSATAEGLRQAGFWPGEFRQGGRVREDGERLSWHLFTVGEGLLGTLPFFIEWGAETQHPARSAPEGCSLLSLRVLDPEAAQLERLMTVLELDVPVIQSPASRLELILETPKGLWAPGC